MDAKLLFDFSYILSNVFRMYIIYLFIKVFFSTNGSRAHIVTRFVLYSLFFFINTYSFLCLHWSSTLILLSNIIGVFIITLSYHGKWSYRISASLLVITVDLTCEDLVYELLLNLHVKSIAPVGMFITDILLLMLVVLLQKVVDFRHGHEVVLAEWIGIMTISIISMVITVMALDKCEGDLPIIVGGVGLLTMDIIVFILFDKLGKLYYERSFISALETQNEAYKKQLAIITQAEGNIASLRHDMNNHIAALEYMIKGKDNEKIQEYLEDIEESLQQREQFANTGNMTIDGIINAKLGEALSLSNVEITCKLEIPADISIDNMDICVILGNLLDNAIQALKGCTSSAKLEIEMRMEKGALYIRTGNNYSGKIISDKKGFRTTKENKKEHGIGLKNVERIVEKYNGEIVFDHDAEWFEANLILFIA